MTNATTSRVRSYLDALERALRGLPWERRDEIVRDIRLHIAGAVADLGTPTEAEIAQILDGLGTPEEIAEAAYAEMPPVRARMAGRDVATVILLLVGGFVLLIGWVVGVVLLWTSTAWRTRDKVIGTLLFPGGLISGLLVVSLGGLVVATSATCSTSQAAGESAATHCSSSGGPGWIGLTIFLTVLVLSVFGPIFSAIWLIRTARRTA